MTKPHFSAEPSMEDILTSIRKMISEERLGPRPVPDQIGRAPFGDTRDPPAAARSSDPEPLPDRAPTARSAPSYASLSDALKAAAPGSAQRRTLEEKIADMLEDGAGPNADTTAPSDSLAVFAASRPQPAAPAPQVGPARETATSLPPSSRPAGSAPQPARQSLGTETPSHRMKPGSGAPQAPTNGAASHREPKPAGSAGPRPGEKPAWRMPPPARSNGAPAPREMGPKDTGPKDISAKDSGPKVVVAKGAAPEDVAPRDGAPKGTGPAPAEPRQPDTQRIIAMPSRQPSAAPGAGTAAGPTMNGASVSPFGSRPAPGAPQAARPAMREADDVMAKVAEKVSDRIAGRGPDAGLHGPAQAGAPPAPTRAEVPREQPTPERETTGPFAGAASAANRSEEGPSPESNAAKPASARAPSEALIDAVVDLVHREPDSLSVFTSGSAFIHGVTGHEPHADKPAVSTRKLDRSAAELLRPMLRQWLADNMPRIVEEALRSELMSSQADADSEET